MDTCQYCKWFHVPEKKKYAGVNVPMPDEKWCRRYPEWKAKDYHTLACGEFVSVMGGES